MGLRSFRKALALFVMAAFLAVSFPVLTTAGGCDEPGGFGNCTHKNSTSPGPIISPPPKAQGPHHHDHDATSLLRSWIFTVISGLIR